MDYSVRNRRLKVTIVRHDNGLNKQTGGHVYSLECVQHGTVKLFPGYPKTQVTMMMPRPWKWCDECKRMLHTAAIEGREETSDLEQVVINAEVVRLRAELAQLRADLQAAQSELDKWRNWMPDDETLAAIKQQATAKDRSYHNSLAACGVYIGALEARLQAAQEERDMYMALCELPNEMKEARVLINAWVWVMDSMDTAPIAASTRLETVTRQSRDWLAAHPAPAQPAVESDRDAWCRDAQAAQERIAALEVRFAAYYHAKEFHTGGVGECGICSQMLAAHHAQPGGKAHCGDPCIYCGTPHDAVAVGDCPGAPAEGL